MASIPDLDGSYTLLGESRGPVEGQTLEVISPVDGSVVGRVHEFTPEEIETALTAAAEQQPVWAEQPLDARARILARAADVLESRADELAELLVMEVAKARKDSRDEVLRSADFIRFTAEEGKRIVGDAQFSDAFPRQSRNKLSISYRAPLGVVLAIPPYNYPINLAVSKIVPALVAGNAIVVKPPTQGSLAGTKLVDAFREAGVPPAVVQAITGRGSRIGDLLVLHPRVDMVSFTGSTETGQSLAKKAAMIPLQLELGGKDAAIVLSDADLEATADDIVSGAFAYSGQRCTAVKRVLAVGDVADELVALLAERIGTLTVGDPRDDVAITPLVDAASAQGAVQMTEAAVAKGARLVLGGTREGNLVAPTLLDHVTPDMDIAWVEPFAPVLPIIRVANAAEAVRLANQSEYGLQAAIFSRDVDVAMHVALALDVGTVQINGKTARGPDHFPFIGTKSSGMGTQGVRYSIEAMTRVKGMVFNMRPLDLETVS
ncbi:aldehyde dehydrogenase family protein [Pseudonocardia sp. H11422]|uniref:aldehyde dehydrogenase family protein n=1 Tax=Pseudonocardia sp. H11422 TaxID=2835866 RepID=UPI0027E3AC42|nr:aldehyde dehydrogenase family protein [Pseudonocardia sp. H11422]